MSRQHDTTVEPLWANVQRLLEAHRPIFSQLRVYWRAVSLFLGELFNFGRHTVTQTLLALGLDDADWTAWYRLFSWRRFDPEKAGAVMLRETLQHVPPEKPYVIVGDGVHVYRHSHKMPGTHFVKGARTAPFRPGLERAQRFVDISWLAPIEEGGWTRAVPLQWVPAFPESAVPAAAAPKKEWEGVLEGVKWVREELDKVGRQEQEVVCVVDGSIERVVEFWRQVPERVFVVGRTARNRALYALPERSKRNGRGRKPRYGKRVRSPAAWLREKKGWRTAFLEVRGRKRKMTYRVEGPFLRRGLPDRPVFLIVVRGLRHRKGKRWIRREPAFFLVQARWDGERWVLPYEVEMLLQWLWQRWEVEVAHREVKSGLGLGEKQCWHPVGTSVAVQWSAWMYGVLILAGYRTWRICGGPQPAGRWYPQAARWSISRLWREIRRVVWSLPEFRALYLGSPNNWPEKSDYLAALWNAALGAARI